MTIDDLKQYYDCLSDTERDELESEGAFLEYPPVEMGYDSDPNNYLAFMSTGGDGVHYSLPKGMKDGKVIMTVPMNFGNENMVVGESLFEFLALGCDFGYFGLEQLMYDFNDTINEIHNAQPRSRALKRFKAHFNLTPWPDIEARLRELNFKA
jgi:hypothetical protein